MIRLKEILTPCTAFCVSQSIKKNGAKVEAESAKFKRKIERRDEVKAEKKAKRAQAAA